MPAAGVYLVDQLSILQVLYSLLKHRQGLIEVDWQADTAQIFANALLQDGPQADALFLLLGRWQGLSPLRRGLHLPVDTAALLGISCAKTEALLRQPFAGTARSFVEAVWSAWLHKPPGCDRGRRGEQREGCSCSKVTAMH